MWAGGVSWGGRGWGGGLFQGKGGWGMGVMGVSGKGGRGMGYTKNVRGLENTPVGKEGGCGCEVGDGELG